MHFYSTALCHTVVHCTYFTLYDIAQYCCVLSSVVAITSISRTKHTTSIFNTLVPSSAFGVKARLLHEFLLFFPRQVSQ